MTSVITRVGVAGLLWLGAAQAQADVLIDYTFDGGSLSKQASTSFAEVQNISDVFMVGNFESGFLARGTSGDALFGFGWPKSNVENEYFAFTFDVIPGNPVQLDGFSVDLAADFKANFAIKAFGSDDGYTLFERQQPPYDATNFQTFGLGTLAGDPSLGLRLDPGSYEFRIIGMNVNGDSRRLLVDNVQLAMSVPEPTALTLWSSLGIAGVGLAFARRRRWRERR